MTKTIQLNCLKYSKKKGTVDICKGISITVESFLEKEKPNPNKIVTQAIFLIIDKGILNHPLKSTINHTLATCPIFKNWFYFGYYLKNHLFCEKGCSEKC